MLAAKYGLTLTSFAVGGATINAPLQTVNAAQELAVYDQVAQTGNIAVPKSAAAVIQLGTNSALVLWHMTIASLDTCMVSLNQSNPHSFRV